MPARRTNLKLGKATIARMKSLLRELERDYGIIDKSAKRKIISRLEARRWRQKAEEWSEKTFRRGGSAAFRKQMLRTVNKMLVLTERFGRAKTSVKRRKIMQLVRQIALPDKEIMNKIPVEQKLNFEAARVALLDAFVESFSKKTTPRTEKIEILRTINHIVPEYAPKIIVNLFEKYPEDKVVRNEVIRLLASNISGTQIQFIKRHLIQSENLDLKILGIDVLANMPSVFAITTLANLTKPPSLEEVNIPRRITREMRANIERILINQSLAERWSKLSREFINKMLEEAQKAARTSSRRFNIYESIFLLGFTAKAIRLWVERFHGKVNVHKNVYMGIISNLEEHKKTLPKTWGCHTAVKYAIKKFDETIEFLRGFI
jgi:hypothetical protein